MGPNRVEILCQRVRLFTCIVIVALVVSGATAIPLQWELETSAKILGVADSNPDQSMTGFTRWILRVRDALRATNLAYPFLAYGTDWLAFGHFAIAIAFVGALRDP